MVFDLFLQLKTNQDNMIISSTFFQSKPVSLSRAAQQLKITPVFLVLKNHPRVITWRISGLHTMGLPLHAYAPVRSSQLVRFTTICLIPFQLIW